jgi:hypothetical protein
MRTSIALAALLALGACQSAARPSAQEVFASYQGRPLRELVLTFGRAPTNVLNTGGGRIYTFEGDQVTLFGSETRFTPGVARTIKCVILAETDKTDTITSMSATGPCGI